MKSINNFYYCKKTIILFIAVFFLNNKILKAAGTTSGDFLNILPDPQSVGVGESILALPDSPSGLISNPSAMKYLYRSKISFSNLTIADGLVSNFIGIGIPLASGTIGFAAQSLSYTDITGYTADSSPVAYSINSSGDMLFLVNYALPIYSNIPFKKELGSAGINLKIIHSSLADYSADTIACDIGGIYLIPLIKGLSTSLVYRNLGPGMKFDKITNPLPSSINCGVRYEKPYINNFFVVFDIGKEKDTDPFMSAGVSISPFYPITIRAGWKSQNNSLNSGLRLGAGIDFNDVSLNYAFSSSRDLPPLHRINVDIGLSYFSKPSRAYEHYLFHYFNEAVEKYNRRDYIGARQIFEEILSVYPDHKPSKKYLEKVSISLDKAEQIKRREIDKYLLKAGEALLKNNIFKAKKYYNYVLTLAPDNQDALEGQKKISYLLNKDGLEKEQIQNQDMINKLWNTAQSLNAQGEYVSAIEKLKEILILSPGNKAVEEYLNSINSKLEKITAMQVNDLYLQGMDLFKAGNYQEALKYFTAAATAAPYNTEAKMYLKKCQDKIEEELNKKKIKELSSHAEKVKAELDSLSNTAVKFSEKDDFDNALKIYIKINEIAVNYKLSSYIESSRKNIAAVKNAISEKHFRHGLENIQNNKIEAGISEFRKAVELNPDNNSAKLELERSIESYAQQFYEQGMTMFSKGDNQKAKMFFEKAIEIKPDKLEYKRALERVK